MARILTEESSLTRRRQKLDGETRVLAQLLRWEAGLAVALVAAGVAVYFYNGQATLLTLGLAAAVFFVAHALRVKQNTRESRIVEAGLRGETMVTRQLAEGLDQTHYLLNDVTLKAGRNRAQIDHVVIAPNGLFAIETKHWRGRIEGRAEDERWRQIKQTGEAPIPVANAVRQTQRHQSVLRACLADAELDWPDVQSIVIFPLKRTEIAVTSPEVPVVYPDDAVTFIQRYQSQRTYSEAEQDAAIRLCMESA
jgi:hypothetical protein